MKNTILTGASVLALSMAAPAFAQSAPTAPATPSAAPGTPECAGTTNNCSLIDQAGTDLSATVTQSGSGNVSDIDQEAGSIEAEATVTQKGTDASSYILQSNAGIAGYPTKATVDQSGQGAESVILQTDTRNHSALVTQVGDSSSFIAQSGGLDTSAEVAQSGGSDNTAIIFQEGGNKASVGDSNPTNNKGGIIQTGSSNNAEIYQGDFTGGSGATGTRATTTQIGDGNDSFIIQNVSNPNVGGTNGQIVNVTQRNDLNISSVVQTGIRDGQRIDVLQDGDRNLSRVEQSDIADSAAGNIVDVAQYGDQNDSFVDQTSATGTARVSQTSEGINGTSPRERANRFDGGTDTVRGNFSRVVQSGVGENSADLSQAGQLNRSDIRQSNASGVATANVVQDGIFNNSDIMQTAAASATVNQLGDYGDNDSLVDQSADGASATVNQYGNNTTTGPDFPTNQSFVYQSSAATAEVTQTGSQNRSTVDQMGNASGALAVVVQTTTPAAIGANDSLNSSTITQDTLSSAFVQQIGQGNTSNVNQTGENGTPDNGFTYAVEVNQLGQDSKSTVIQTGLGNEARLTQTAGSELNESLISQGGNDNLAEVLQAGVSNLSEVYQGGNNNTADVSQYSDNNRSFVNQGGNGNTATVVQGTM